MAYVQNPIIKGFYPDPSICRVGDTYYRVHSTFGYAPGIPLFKSHDLVNWEQIGNVLTRSEQLCLDDVDVTGGIFAPTIRYDEEDKLFYVIVTNVDMGGKGVDKNFYVTAKDPAGPWSDPVVLEGACGIDPSLYFENGHCFYIGQRQKKDAAYFGDCEIWIQEIDREKGKLIGESKALWDGAMKNAWWPEGPHLYKIGDYYYLMIAEGGTGPEHSISIARSKDLFGPYESCRRNPVFTHRHLGGFYPVQCAGHGDLVDTPSGDWYIVMLAVRVEDGVDHCGRETFIADVTWEDGWPVINAGDGKLRETQLIKTDEENQTDVGDVQGVCTMKQDLNWDDYKAVNNRVVGVKRCLLSEEDLRGNRVCKIEKNRLIMDLKNTFFEGDQKNNIPEVLLVRQTEHDFSFEATVDAKEIQEGSEAGIIWLYNEKNYYTLGIMKLHGKNVLLLTKKQDGFDIEAHILNEDDILSKSLGFIHEKNDLKVTLDGKELMHLTDTTHMCTRHSDGFTGCMIGIYGSCEDAQAEGGSASFGPMKIRFS